MEEIVLTTTDAREWLARWDRQQEHYVANREERFDVIIDVVSAAAGRPDPLVIDVGTGPGSLSARLLARLPQAQVVAVDADPALLALAGAALGDLPGLRLVEVDVRRPGWVERLDLPRPADAVISTTALHWLDSTQLADLYAACAGLLRPGGVLVNGDNVHPGEGDGRLRELEESVTDAQAERTGVSAHEDWAAWWQAAAAAPELADLARERQLHPIAHHVPDLPTLGRHLRSLTQAGFVEAGTVWQHGSDRVVVGVR